ncbi:DUF4142 domain-containing protein [Pedobacter deserti]|uniref:DUF4142 domain-containing protein n=1 Tax=Pedobacter deserti TaxID=2817382 RepID=UPI00210E68D8|nr:DUF4142 domain-containing protein [Pedobacter sp. SYSU D00382]
MKPLSFILVSSLSACMLLSCAGRRNSTDSGSGITTLTPAEKNPSVAVMNATGDALTPSVTRTNGAGNRENAERIADGAINQARATVQASGGAVVQPITTITPGSFATSAMEDHQLLRNDLKKFSSGRQTVWRDSVTARLGAVNPSLLSLVGPQASQEGTERAKSLAQIVSQYRSTIAMFEANAKSDDKEVSAYASKYLPVLRRHLAQAQRLIVQIP